MSHPFFGGSPYVHSHLPQTRPRPHPDAVQKPRGTFHPRPQVLGDILPIVLARLGIGGVESTGSGEKDLT
jgi:hypothetical protein